MSDGVSIIGSYSIFFGATPGPMALITSANNNVTLYNVWVNRVIEEGSSLYIDNRGRKISNLNVIHSVFNDRIEIYNYYGFIWNAWFIETYFNESAAELINTAINNTWTIDIHAISTYTNMPISGVYIQLYNGSDLWATGYTNSGGDYYYTLTYTIDDENRTAPYLSVIGTIDTSSATVYNTGGLTLPSWYTKLILELNYTLLSITGQSNNGLSTLTVTGKTGILKVYRYIDPINPANNRFTIHKIKVLNQYTSNNIKIFNILISIEVAGKEVWLPSQLIIDENTETILLTGPITMYAHF